MPKADTKPLFKLTDQDYEVMHFFISMRRTMMNLQRNLDNLRGLGNDIVSRQNAISNDHLPTLVRKTDGLEQGIEQKSSAILVRLPLFLCIYLEWVDFVTYYSFFSGEGYAFAIF